MHVDPRVTDTSFAQPHYARHCSIRVTRCWGKSVAHSCIHVGCATLPHLSNELQSHVLVVGTTKTRRVYVRLTPGSARLLEECSLQVQPRRHQRVPTQWTATTQSHSRPNRGSHHTLGYISCHAPSLSNLARVGSALDHFLRAAHDCMRRASLKPWTPCLLPRRALTSPPRVPPRRSCSPRRARTASR
jgi:hypothetical protein